jgi:polyhydroxybutyrate depolymerase
MRLHEAPRAARALIAALILFALPAAARDAALQERLLPGGRSYLFALPDGVAHPPVIVGLHGGGGNPRQFARNSGLVAAALAEGYAVALPAGSGRGAFLTWNAGHCCAYAARNTVDDIGFLDAVAADMARRSGTGAVFVTGMSNGAMMAGAWAARRPRTVRAAVLVAGTVDLARFPPGGQVALLHIHGTADPRVPFGGGQGQTAATRALYPAVAEEAAAFALPWSAKGPEIRAEAGATRSLWRDASGRVVVALLAVTGGDHEWFGGRRAGGTGVSATREALDFFDLWRD